MKKTINRAILILLLTALLMTLFSPAPVRAFDVEDGFNPSPNNNVLAVVVQPDGKILVGGYFTSIEGEAVSYLARLNADGSLDGDFTSPSIDGGVETIALQPDGKILIGGVFETIAGQSHLHIARLHPNGSVDSDFTASISSGNLYTIAVQPDGKILLGGMFDQINGIIRVNLAQLNADGSLDESFTAQTSSSGSVQVLALQPNGKILVGGSYDDLAGGTKEYFGRLNANGTLDSTCGGTVVGSVDAIDLQADGKIVIGGLVNTVDGSSRTRIARLNPDCSLDTDFDPILGNGAMRVFSIAVQPNGKILICGLFATVNGESRANIARLNLDGTTDLGFNPGASGIVRTQAVQQDGSILLGGEFTTLAGEARSFLGRLYPDGSLDDDLNPGANSLVLAFALQPDGKILVGGNFSDLGGFACLGLARLMPDGSIDPSFTCSTGYNPVRVDALAVQPDGKILVGGYFTFTDSLGSDHSALVRLMPDGTVDPTFDPQTQDIDWIYAISVLPDGKIMVAGSFTSIGGQNCGNVARLYSDGSADNTFIADVGSTILAMVVQPDGKVVVAGEIFPEGGGVVSGILTRLNNDGSQDTSFADPAPSLTVISLALQDNGQILVGGMFYSLGGEVHANFGRLNSDGTIDSDFNPILNGYVDSILIQIDGKMLIGGRFTSYNSVACNRIAKLAPDGTLEDSFGSGADNMVLSLTQQADGKILAGGNFSTLNGLIRNRIGRFSNEEAGLQDLSVEDNVSISWMRDGASPELHQAIFEISTDGEVFSPLGIGTRIAGGWTLDGLDLQYGTNLFIRARGYYYGGHTGGSWSGLETTWNIYLAPVISYIYLPMIIK